MSCCGLKNDIFISYAHADNTEGWIDKFHERLLNKLRQLDRRADFSIWRDGKLTGADVFTEEIDGQLKSSGILISVLSPNGLDSSWCQKERQCFERAAGLTGGIHLETSSRAIRVTKTPCPEDKDRQIFGNLGYEFYQRSEQTGRFSEFHPSEPEFDRKVLDLAQTVQSNLTKLRARLLAPPSDLGVYVASVTSGLAPWRTRVIDQLSAWNCRVSSEPVSVAQLSTASIHESLQSCAFSIHLIGPQKGMVPEDESLPIDLLQLACARSARMDRIICHVGQPHSGWQDLPKAEGIQGREDLITNPEDLLQLVEDRIGNLRKRGSGATGNLPTVYVICSPQEFEDAIRLKNCLEAEQQCAATLPLREVDDARVRLKDHRETLKECESVLIYWGNASDAIWFRQQQREVIGARKKRRAGKLPALCLASSPYANPEVDARPDLPLKQILSLDCPNVRGFFRHLEIGKNGKDA
jgi:hypothetical protein